MNFSIGIIGLPNVGKSTFFQALTKIPVNIANYPFTTIKPNIGVVTAPDKQLEQIAEIFHSKKILPFPLEFYDIAGLVKGSHQGLGLGNQFLARIRECDALIHIIRVFQNPQIVHPEGEINALRDFEIVQNELQFKDSDSKEKFNLLAEKPQLLLINGKKQEAPPLDLSLPYLFADLSSDNWIVSGVIQVFEELFKLLDLIVFYTANENEARSWLIKKGTSIKQAAGLIHSDFEEKFIKAEVINWQKLCEAGNWQKSKFKGWLRLEGRDYLVQNNDVILFKI